MQRIIIHHSPDADDAFMFHGLASGKVNYPGFEFDHELCDIETLNHRAVAGEVDVTAVSVHAYAHLGGRYVILRCGASMGGEDYGPRLIAKPGTELVRDVKTIAVPGKLTSAALALGLYLKSINCEIEFKYVAFDKVQDEVKVGRADAALIIHEGQLTHSREGTELLVDLGAWWWKDTGLPLPLGVNIARKDLGPEAIRAVSTVLRESIDYALEHREEALEYALTYGRGLSTDDADTFVGMYVNERTQDIGEDGIRSIKLFLERGVKAGLVPAHGAIEFA